MYYVLLYNILFAYRLLVRGPLRTAEGAEGPGDGIPHMSNLLKYLTL